MLDQAFIDTTVAEAEQLAADARFASRSHDLDLLAQDLRKPDGDLFAGVDLFAAFPEESIEGERKRTFLEGAAGVLAGVSVFLPVAWTWWGFRDASAAYRDLIEAEGDPEGVTFLSLWTTGFDGRLTSWHQLVPMAMVSLLLILFAICAVVAHRLIAGANVRGEERAHSAARQRLMSVLTHAQVVMNARRADHPERIEGIVKSTLEKLEAAQHATNEVVANLEKAGESVGVSLEGLVAVAGSSRKEASRLLSDVGDAAATLGSATKEASAALTSSVVDLRSTVMSGVEQTQQAVASSATALETVVADSSQQTVSALTGSANQLVTDLQSAMASFERDLGSHLDGFAERAVGEVERAGRSLHTVVDAIGVNAAANTEAARELGRRVTEMTDDNAATRQELALSLESIRETLFGIEAALDRHENVMQGQTSELTGARDSAERLLRRLSLSGGQAGGGN